MGETLKMDHDAKLKGDKVESIKIIDEQINLLKNLEDINTIKQEFKEVIKRIADIITSKDVLDRLKTKAIYQENEYSKERTEENILKAKIRVIEYLEDILNDVKNKFNDLIDYNNEFSQESAILAVKKILNNFYMHIKVMYEEPVHGRAGITKENLDNIKIVNEYDVQRMLYSLIKPIFPEARLEVSTDTGFSTVRFDIFIEKFSIVIEVKCSRPSMTERKLTEEIGSDIFHYKFTNIFFFIYDKEKIIKNSTAFKNTYSTSFDQKNIDTVIIQPITL